MLKHWQHNKVYEAWVKWTQYNHKHKKSEIEGKIAAQNEAYVALKAKIDEQSQAHNSEVEELKQKAQEIATVRDRF